MSDYKRRITHVHLTVGARHCPDMAKKPAPPHRLAFARRLQAARIAAGYETMRDFSSALGIEEARYRRWEAAETEPDIMFLERISRITRANLNVLIAGQRADAS